MDEKTILFVKEHENDDVRTLALQANRYSEIDMPFVVRQITGRKIARDKIPSWYSLDEIIYPPHLSLQQSSSEKTAKYKASLCKGNTFADLTGGMGVDFSFMSRKFHEVTYVEAQEELAEIARHNFKVSGLTDIRVHVARAEEYLKDMDAVDTLYLDPARRSNTGAKTVLIKDCTPNITELEQLLEQKSSRTIIKLSPMLDIVQALNTLKNVSEVHIVSVSNECKELLFIKEKPSEDIHNTVFYCINIHNDHRTDIYTFDKETENTLHISCTNKVKKYLYEPNASILKAGAYKSVGHDFKVEKLHPNSHLYTSDEYVENFTGRRFIVKDILPFNKKNIKDMTACYKQANISVRNFPLTVDEIRKKTGIKEGGEIYIFATTLSDNQKILVIAEKH